MVEEIKNLRVKIDGLAQLTKGLNPIKNTATVNLENPKWGIPSFLNSKEIERSVDSLYLAKAWLGKCLGELNVPTPYKNDGNRKTVEDIEPTADSVIDKDGIYHNMFTIDETVEWNKKSHIEKVDWLRQETQKAIYEQADIHAGVTGYAHEFYGWKFVYQHLCEARFWLGFELQRIKEAE